MLYYFIVESTIRKRMAQLPPTLSLSFESGWGNGYVLIDSTHPFYGKDYDELEVWAHGGITLACKYDEFNIIQRGPKEDLDIELSDELKKRIEEDGYDFLKNYWVIGFDTGHYQDSLQTCPKEYVLNETKQLYKQCLDNRITVIRKNKLKKLDYERQNKR